MFQSYADRFSEFYVSFSRFVDFFICICPKTDVSLFYNSYLRILTVKLVRQYAPKKLTFELVLLPKLLYFCICLQASGLFGSNILWPEEEGAENFLPNFSAGFRSHTSWWKGGFSILSHNNPLVDHQ